MITSRERLGKDLQELTMMDLIEEYRNINLESGILIRNVFDIGITEEQKNKLNDRCLEYENYQNKLACEFITRFLK